MEATFAVSPIPIRYLQNFARLEELLGITVSARSRKRFDHQQA
jgi:hypothetical protein